MPEGQERQEQQQQEGQVQAPAPPTPPAATIDEDKLGKLLEERLSAGLRQFRQEEQVQEQQARAQQEAQDRARQDTFGQLVLPYVQPAVQALQFENAATRDFVNFYTSNQEAITRKDAIEAKFQEMAQQGRAIPREDINSWLVGREKLQQDRETAAKKALEASTLNPGVGQREALMNKDPYEMTQDERRQFLSGISF